MDDCPQNSGKKPDDPTAANLQPCLGCIGLFFSGTPGPEGKRRYLTRRARDGPVRPGQKIEDAAGGDQHEGNVKNESRRSVTISRLLGDFGRGFRSRKIVL